MSALDAAVSTWVDLLGTLDRCPWPGPRPLHVGDAQLLVGRDQDRKQFRHEVDSHRLILLAGVSGVGKTSLLDAGLQPELTKAERYRVAICREWGAAGDGSRDAVAFLAGKIREVLPAEDKADLPDGPDFFWALEQRFEDRLVLVLDQFEELIRFDRVLKDDVVDLLIEINRRMKIKVIISLRSEYLHELRELENRAMPFTLSRYLLEDVDPSFAEEIVLAPQAPRTDGQLPPAVIELDVARRIAEDWQQAMEGAQGRGADPFGRIGLLHLQAVLYAVHALADGEIVGQEAYDLLLDQASDHANVFTYGIVKAIDLKLHRCEQAFRQRGVDDYRLEGVQSLLVRAVPKLASGGYKLVREARDLLDEVLEPELGVLIGALGKAKQDARDDPDPQPNSKQLRELKDTVLRRALSDDAQLLHVDRRELAAAADKVVCGAMPWVDRLHEGAPPAIADMNEVSCGPVAGLAPAAVLIEELRRFALMLAWLRASSLVRMTTPGATDLMVSLIHDGFGEGLRQWAQRRRKERPASDALHALTAPFGAFFDWGAPEIFDGGKGHRVFANLRWRGDTVRATFRRVVFVSCDFRGTLFESCTFEGVTFVNCRFDGSLLSDCRIVGPLPAASGEISDEEPQFLVAAEENRLLPSMQHYQRLPIEAGRVFLSQHVGRPAIPAPREAAVLERVRPVDGGLAIMGGRLSAFTIRGAKFFSDSRLSFRHVAGSGLDLAEQADGQLEIFGCALRHLTVTAPDFAGEARGFHLDMRKSLLVQTWIGDTVRGSGRADDCMLIQFWNGSPGMAIKVSSSTVLAGFGATVVDDATQTAPAASADLARRARRMDYTRISQSYDASTTGVIP